MIHKESGGMEVKNLKFQNKSLGVYLSNGSGDLMMVKQDYRKMLFFTKYGIVDHWTPNLHLRITNNYLEAYL